MSLFNRKEKIKKICPVCGNGFSVLPSRNKKVFCSNVCFGFYRRGEKRCGNYKSNSGSFMSGSIPWNKGLKTPEKTKRKQSEAKFKNPTKYWLNKKRLEMRKDIKSGWSNFRNQISERTEYKNWRRSVFERDNYTCKNCGYKNEKGRGKTVKLNAHHIIRVKDDINLITDIDNGTTVCVDCHKELHKIVKK